MLTHGEKRVVSPHSHFCLPLSLGLAQTPPQPGGPDGGGGHGGPRQDQYRRGLLTQ